MTIYYDRIEAAVKMISDDPYEQLHYTDVLVHDIVDNIRKARICMLKTGGIRHSLVVTNIKGRELNIVLANY